MDEASAYSVTDFLLAFCTYAFVFLAWHFCKFVLFVSPSLREKRKLLSSGVVLVLIGPLVLLRGTWLPLLPFADTIPVVYALATIFWLVLGHFTVQVLDALFWSGDDDTEDEKPGVPLILQDMIRLLVYVAAFTAILHFVYEQPITGLVATSGVLAIVLGYSAQSTLGQIFSGLSLNMAPVFRRGDYVEIDGNWGRVVDITWRHITLEDWQENYLTLPNSVVSNAKIKNFTKPTSRRAMVIYVAVPYGIPPERVKRALVEAAKESPDVLDAYGSPWAALWEYRDYGALYQIYCYTKHPYDFAVKGGIHNAIWYRFRREGIPIAIQRSEVILRKTAPRAPDDGRSALDMLHQVPLFSLLEEEELADLARKAKLRVFGHPERVVRQHDEGSSLFIVKEGELEVLTERKDGTTLKLAQIGPYSVFGEMALLTGEPRGATIRPLAEATVYEIEKRDLEDILKNRPELLTAISTLLAQRQLEDAQKTSEPKGPSPETVRSLRGQFAKSMRRFFGFEED